MKKIKSLIMALFVVFLATFQAFAFADVRVFNNSSGDGFENFQKYLEKEGVLHNGVFPTKVLSNLAYKLAEEKGYLELVPEEMRSPEKYQGIFLARNNLGATITVDQFRAQGQGAGFWLPTILAKEKPAVAVEAHQLGALSNELTKLKGEIAKARAEAQSSDTKLAKKASENLEKLNQQLGIIRGQVDTLPKSARVEKVAGQVEALLRDINDVKKAQEEQGTSISKLWLAVGGATLLGLLGFALSLIGNFRVSTVKKETKVAITGVVDRLEVIEKEVGRLDIKIADNLPERLEATQIGRECNFSIEVEGTRFSLLATRVEEGYVTLTGVRDQQNKVAIATVVSVLKKAARQGRIQGIVPLVAVA